MRNLILYNIYFRIFPYFRKCGGDRAKRWQTRETEATSDAFHTGSAQRAGKVFHQNSLPGYLPERRNSSKDRPHGKSRSGRCGQNVHSAVRTKWLIQRALDSIAWLRTSTVAVELHANLYVMHIKIDVISSIMYLDV